MKIWKQLMIASLFISAPALSVIKTKSKTKASTAETVDDTAAPTLKKKVPLPPSLQKKLRKARGDRKFIPGYVPPASKKANEPTPMFPDEE